VKFARRVAVSSTLIKRRRSSINNGRKKHMGSTISGNAGASSNGALVTLVPVDIRGVIIGTPIQNIVGTNGGNASGVYSFAGLAKGYYLLQIAPAQPNPSGAPAPENQTQVMTQPQMLVDGSSAYNI
jgi:hypothetical protein